MKAPIIINEAVYTAQIISYLNRIYEGIHSRIEQKNIVLNNMPAF